jgi:Phage integrase, N-terminal SAM-like domain
MRGLRAHNVSSQTQLGKRLASRDRLGSSITSHGKRHIKTFEQKKDADAYHTSVKIDVSRGTHTPESRSITVVEAAQLWLTTCENHGVERTTLTMYRQHVHLHIVPYLGRVKLSQLSTTLIRDFEDKLRSGAPAPGAAEGASRSPAMMRKIGSSLGARAPVPTWRRSLRADGCRCAAAHELTRGVGIGPDNGPGTVCGVTNLLKRWSE